MIKNKWTYNFQTKTAEGRGDMRNLLGGKGAGLAEMCLIGLPVPPGFTITTKVCNYYYKHERTYPLDFKDQVISSLNFVEKISQRKLGDNHSPLLVSVRSGSRASMPGMMDTILNLGLNDETTEGLSQLTQNPRFAYDSYRRFIQMYSSIVLGVKHEKFEQILHLAKFKANVSNDHALTSECLKDIISEYKKMVQKETGEDFPQNVETQLFSAIGAVFQSWMNDRAIMYRKLNDIPSDWGTAVTVQAMVFGNLGDDCATGVAFTRNPSNGDNSFYGEYLINAQGEDVVAGIRTPQQITIQGKKAQNSSLPAMEEVMPKIFAQLDKIRHILENHYKDMQDIEFTIQNGKLFILQTRNGKRTTQAAIKIAVDLCNEGVITKSEAILSVNPTSLNQLLHPTLDPKAKKNIIAVGLPASPGACQGEIVLTTEDAVAKAKDGTKVILIREETSPEDIHGMNAAQGILTSRGGMTSHAAVVARGMGRPCVCGAGDIKISSNGTVDFGKKVILKVGDIITLDGSTGEVILGKMPTVDPILSEEYIKLMTWADKIRRLKIRANAETPKDAFTASKFGAEGIGLCRTEHMFFEPGRILQIRRWILADNEDEKKRALSELLPMQVNDFVELFKIMKGKPVTIRLLDPPLHEFLPKEESDFQLLAKITNSSLDNVKQRAHALREENPMLGNRGCRLGISSPQIYEMQVHAIFTSVIQVHKETGNDVIPEIMIPLAFSKKELEILKVMIDTCAENIGQKFNYKFKYIIGTMIELPRACLVADELAETADFFSFGTNDLTQTTFGISRDDAATFLGSYKHHNIISHDPFSSLDVQGVGRLMEMAFTYGKKSKPHLKVGICGEHGGDPKSIKFADELGLDYVSCSPFRIPIARLAAAQAFITNEKEGKGLAARSKTKITPKF